MRVLISGAGVAGLTTAFWLAKAGHRITIVERFNSLRKSGLQVDLRGPGLEVMRLMGLEQTLKEHTAPEQGFALVNSSGKRYAYFPASSAEVGRESFTAEFEIMRGDLCQVLYDALDSTVDFIWDASIQSYTETDQQIHALLSNGATVDADILISAEGQWSNTRKLILGDAAAGLEPLKGIYCAYFGYPQAVKSDDEYVATMYLAGNARSIMTRRSKPDVMQGYMLCRNDSAKLATCKRGSIAVEKEAMREIFAGSGWITDDLCAAMMESDNFYLERLGVIKNITWSKGRAVLVGDAAYGASALTGMGTTIAMVGAYILAKEIETSCTGDIVTDETVKMAFKSYEDKMRPLVTILQKGITDDSPRVRLMIPSSSIALSIMKFAATVTSKLKLDTIFKLVLKDETKKWLLPRYPTTAVA